MDGNKAGKHTLYVIHPGPHIAKGPHTCWVRFGSKADGFTNDYGNASKPP